MSKDNNSKALVLFEDKPVRRVWSEKNDRWYFSITDIVMILTQSNDPRNYWKVLKSRLKKEGSEVVTKCNQLKLMAKDGKKYLTDVADAEAIFRIIQSIPSPKAEPFKQWLARVGYERLRETVNPEIAVNRARKNWLDMGHSEKWVEQRMRGQEIRNKLTDYWRDNEVKPGKEYAKLTDLIHKEWSGLTTGQHKRVKGLKDHNLRDNMTDAEVLFTALAELSTREIAEKDEAKGFAQNAGSAKKGGNIAKNARKQLEEQTGKKIVSKENFLPPIKEKKRLK